MSFIHAVSLAAAVMSIAVVCIELEDVTREIFHNGQYLGVVAAFGDFNSDKLTDLFCIQQGDETLEILLSNETEPFFGKVKLNCTFKSIITGVIPGDYDGDSKMDVLVVLQHEGSGVMINILWGSYHSIDCNTNIIINMSSQPFILDYNDDMIPDIMGEDEQGERCVWLSSGTRNFKKESAVNGIRKQKLKSPHSCSVLDMDQDLVSDLLITGNDNIEIWFKKKQGYVLAENVHYPKDAKVKGQLTFVDFNMNGEIDYIMPICHDSKCHESSISWLDVGSMKWVNILNNFTHNSGHWGFIINERTAVLPITLRSGDFNLDGYPDFITVLENKEQPSKRKVVILENVFCTSCPLQRTLKILWDVKGLNKIENLQLAAFFDVYENGIMDVIASSLSDGQWKTHIFKNTDTYDAYFIKVLVLSGICDQDCPRSKVPYGTNQPGPMIMFNTTKPDGDPLTSCAVQMPQSAYFALNLPYTVFGLGQTPNFVDHLTVGIPIMKNNQSHKREWTQIIPNSQMVVIPHPPENEKMWVNKLFLTPSNLVVRTCFALIGTCGFIALLIGILHWRERKEDKREKMQNAYRFTL